MSSFVSLSGIEKLDQLLNKIKIKTLECFNSIFRYILDEVPNQTKLESPFLAKGKQLCPYFINTLVYMADRPDLEELLLDEYYHDILTESMEALV